MTEVIPYEPRYPIHPKSPKAVLVLNVFPGLGNLYAEGMRGFIWLAVAGAMLYIFPNILTWLLAYAVVTTKAYKAAQKHNNLIAEGKLPDSLKNIPGLTADEIKKQVKRSETELGAKLTEYSVLVAFIEILKALQVKVEGTIGIFEKKVNDILSNEPPPVKSQDVPGPVEQAPAFVQPPDTMPAPVIEESVIPQSPQPAPQQAPEEEQPRVLPEPVTPDQSGARPGGKYCIECGAARDPNFAFCIKCGAGSVTQT